MSIPSRVRVRYSRRRLSGTAGSATPVQYSYSTRTVQYSTRTVLVPVPEVATPSGAARAVQPADETSTASPQLTFLRFIRGRVMMRSLMAI